MRVAPDETDVILCLCVCVHVYLHLCELPQARCNGLTELKTRTDLKEKFKDMPEWVALAASLMPGRG